MVQEQTVQNEPVATQRKERHIPRLVIGGTQSGVGKTTIMAGLLAAFREQGLAVQSFKVGPDYIDPGFHKIASGLPSPNLDTWLVPPEDMPNYFAQVADNVDLVLIEGVMGLYDGGRKGISSTADIAKRLYAPVVLIINTSKMGESGAALALGFREYDKEISFGGVLLNRLGSENHEKMIRQGLERLDIPVYGAIYRDEAMQSPERHLGLTPVTEIDPREVIVHIAEKIKKEVDLDGLYELAKSAPPLVYEEEKMEQQEVCTTIGVAYDKAFSFYYPASLEALERAGASIQYFSPLKDETLPPVDGLFFGGGFPEMFLEDLSANQPMLSAIKEAAQKGMPIYGECGGFMYLCNSIQDFEGRTFTMTGVINGDSKMEPKLQRVGYVTSEALCDSILCDAGDTLRGHEFHFSSMTMHDGGGQEAFLLEGGRVKKTYKGGYVSAKGNVLASYLHINFRGAPKAAKKFVAACAAYGGTHE